MIETFKSLLFAIVICSFSSCGQKEIIPSNATPQLLSDEFQFTEGPAADSEGNIFFTDQPNDRIYKWSADSGEISLWMENTGRANGLYFDNKGNLISCSDENSELWEIDPDRNVKVILEDINGKRMNGPNDLWIDEKGGIYFTDPYYQRAYWNRKEPDLESKNVYYLSPDRSKVRVVAQNFVQPNGIIGSADKALLYISDIGSGKTYSYKIMQDGSLTDKELFVEMGSDGMTLDERGNVYLTGKGVTIFDEKGSKIANIPVDQDWTANVTFGGQNNKTLFITASKAIYKLDMNVQGAN
ncbi:SMP-30/gluconolactonase/LRE family protein [Gramella sp. GC03-9]|uniref:SMP-30/gluconolactonase/LRE family protein n=1 Tax=Christiangramia oceanisediminis TaxID=2920386 RepID=A0A9X2KWC6_9FLAO|nr:SMP-30/gluconolactonase/LRE family protein [Gramella oceanisediminis]MCP9200082.1 SMP-30/gluconolactonase/LRE family protein [Gramella oceanisediminis]